MSWYHYSSKNPSFWKINKNRALQDPETALNGLYHVVIFYAYVMKNQNKCLGMIFMKSHDILNKNYQKFQKKKFQEFFQIFKAWFEWLITPVPTPHTPQKMGNFAKVHLAKKNWKSIQGFIVKIGETCFEGSQLKRPNQSPDGPKIGAILTAAVKLVYRYEMVMMGWHLLLFFSILIFSWFLRILDRRYQTAKPAGLLTQKVVGTFNFSPFDLLDIIISLNSIMPFLITFTP